MKFPSEWTPAAIQHAQVADPLLKDLSRHGVKWIRFLRLQDLIEKADRVRQRFAKYNAAKARKRQ
jgi:hypothetical protein